MQSAQKRLTDRLKNLTLSIGLTTLVGCASGVTQEPQPINIDGSSTVYPLTQAIGQDFNQQNTQPIEIKVNFSGTGGGFKKFCNGETDINNASRPIKPMEMDACRQAGVAYIELPVAFDALTVAVHPQNTWANDISLEELKKLWEPAAQGKIKTWNQIRSTWPNTPIKLYGPGKDSGTFDYFTEAIVGQSGASRTDYIASEDDEVLEKGVSSDLNALGYFGFSYYEQNQQELKALAIKNNRGSFLPSRLTVERSEYQPLARPLFIYVNASAAQNNPALQEFVKFYLKKAPETVIKVGYIPLPAEGYRLTNIHFERGKVGTVFEGKSELSLTIDELLRKQAQF